MPKFINKPFSLSKSFIIFLVCFSVFTFLISLGFFLKHYYNTKNTINQKLEYQSGRIENTFVEAIEYTNHSMGFIGKQIADNKKQNDYEFIRRLLVSYRVPDNRIMEFSTFAWANEKHRFIVSSNKGLHFDRYLDLSKRDYIPKTISNPFQIHLGNPAYGIYSGKYSIPAGYGVMDKNDKYLGAVITSFVITGLQRKLSEVINDNGVSFILMQKDGLFIAASSKINYKKIEDYLQNQLSKIRNKKEGMLYDAGFFNNQDFGSVYYNNLQKYPYVIFTIYNKQLQKVEIYDMIFSHIIIFCLLLAVVVTLLFLFYSNLVKPIISIADAAKKIANNEQDIKIARCSSIEINQLARSILSIKKFIKKEKYLKQQLSQANTNLQQLTQSINHDLRNYISGISGLAKIIAEEETSPQIKKYSQMIIKQSDNIFHMAQDLLNRDLSNTNFTEIRKLEKCNIKDLLEELIFLNRDFVDKHQIKIYINIQDDLPYLKTDKITLRRILDNLITNAVKYSHKGSKVEIAAQYLTKQQKIYIEIADHGIGMTADQIKMALSGKGAEIDKSELDKPIDSYGIGLPTVKKMVEELKAEMEIESQKSIGTTLKLFFPLEVEAANENKEIEDEKIKVLIVDDQEVNLLTIKSLLEKNINNIDCTLASSGNEALEIIADKNKAQEKFDLILTDIQMPKIDGFDLAKTIRKYDKNTVIVAYSSMFYDKMAKVNHPEINQFLGKPIADDLLIRTVEKWTLNDFINLQKGIVTKEELEEIKNKRIVFADDEKINQILMQKMLKDYGIIVETVGDGEELIKKFKESQTDNSTEHNKQIDLIISDMKMPIIDGIEAIKEIRATEIAKEFYHTMPIIAYSGDKDIAHKAFSDGFDDYYLKGAPKEKLVKMIALWLRVKKQPRKQTKDKIPRIDFIVQDKAELDSNNIFDEELAKIFLRDSKKLMQEVVASNQEQDQKRFDFASHALKGVFGVTRLHRLFYLISNINNIAKQKKWANKEQVKELEEEFMIVEEDLKKRFRIKI